MTDNWVRRGKRLPSPRMPVGKIVLAAPPRLDENVGPPAALRTSLLAVMGLALVMAAIVLLAGIPDTARLFVALAIFVLLAAVVTAGWFVPWTRRRLGRGSRRLTARRAQYLRYITQLQEELRGVAQAQRHGLVWRHPEPEDLIDLIDERTRLWERRPGDADFLVARIGTGKQSLAVELVPPRTLPVEYLDPGTSMALRDLVERNSVVPDLPVAIALTSFKRIALCGELEVAQGLARSILCQVMVFHGPDDVLIDGSTAIRSRINWRWLEWLPHARRGADRFTIRVFDGGPEPPLTESGTSIWIANASELPQPQHRDGIVLECGPNRLDAKAEEFSTYIGLPDYLSAREAHRAARRLSVLRLADEVP